MAVSSKKWTEKVNNARVKYQGALDVYISECQIIWSRYSAMLIFNTLLFSFIGLIEQKSLQVSFYPILLPVLGLISCYVWFATADRGFKWIDYWISAANQLEQEYLFDECKILNPVVYGAEYKKLIPHLTTPILAKFLIVCIGLIYLLLLLPYLKHLV